MKRANIAFFLLGFLFLGVTIAKVGPQAIVDATTGLGWLFWAVAAINLVWYAADAMGWGAVIGRAGGRGPRWAGRLVLAQVAGEALNNATPLMNLGGEPMKGLLLRDKVPADQVVTSLVVDNTLKYLSTIVFIALGLGLSFFFVELSWQVRVGLAVALGVSALAIAGVLAIQTRHLVGRLLELGVRLRIPFKDLPGKRQTAARIDHLIGDFYARRRRGFAVAMAWHLGSRILATLDAWLIMSVLGFPVDLLQALFIQTVSVLLNLMFMFIPLALGAAEGGHYFLFQAMGLDPATGVVFSLVRRVRGLVWIGIGLLIVLVLSRRKTANA